MAKKRKKKKSERQKNLEGYTKVLEILSKVSNRRMLRGRYYSDSSESYPCACVIGILANHYELSDLLTEHNDKKIEELPKNYLEFFTRHIPLAVLVELQIENDWRFESEMTSEERYANMVYFLQQKIANLLDPTKVTSTV